MYMNWVWFEVLRENNGVDEGGIYYDREKWRFKLYCLDKVRKIFDRFFLVIIFIYYLWLELCWFLK